MIADASIESTFKKGLFRLRAGSTLWLLRHELRLYFYEMSTTQNKGKRVGKRSLPIGSIIAFAFLYGFLHFIAWGVIRFIPALDGVVSSTVLMSIGFALLVLFTLMLSIALSRSVAALFERGDLDLLLSSPLPTKVIFRVRLAGITVGVALMAIFFLSPFSNVGLFLGQFRWLAIYPTILGLAMISASLAMWLTLGMVKMFGIRKTRVLAQLLGAFVGALMFLASQAFGNLGQELKVKLIALVKPWFAEGGVIGPDSWVWIPSKAMLGAPFELIGFTLFAALCFWSVANLTHRFFIRGVQQAGVKSNPALIAKGEQPNALTKKRFVRGILRNLILKEWRLVWRDPQLISQVFLQILYMLPAFFLIFKGKAFLPGTAAGMTLLCAFLASSLIWIMVCGEDAADLLLSSPVPQPIIRRGKLLAALIPPLLFIAIPLLWLSMTSPLSALITLLGCGIAMHNIAMINLWMAKAGNRTEFNRRANGNLALTLLEKFNSFAWAGTVFVVLQFGWWALIPAALALTTLLMAWILKKE